MESFAISSFAIIEEITSASEAEKDSPFVVKTSQCFALTYFCWPSKLTKFLLTTSPSLFLGLLMLKTGLDKIIHSRSKCLVPFGLYGVKQT